MVIDENTYGHFVCRAFENEFIADNLSLINKKMPYFGMMKIKMNLLSIK